MTEQEEYKKNFFQDLHSELAGIHDSDEVRAIRSSKPKSLTKEPAARKPRKSRKLFDYYTPEFRRLRLEALLWYGERCMKCGVVPSDGVYMTIDHIKPISKFPELSMEKSNLQVLCMKCNKEKSNKHCGDFRGM